MIAFMPALWSRLLGISLASFSSGLGELTYLQLSTRYGRFGAGKGVGWFSSGTGAAGLVGASAWWLVRPLGVKYGLFSLSFLPLMMGITYAIILPNVEALEAEREASKGSYEAVEADDEFAIRDSEDEPGSPARASLEESRAMLAVSPHASTIQNMDESLVTKDVSKIRLTFQDKITLIKPMLFVYILPLVLVYFFE